MTPDARNTEAQFAYDASRKALVFMHPEKSGHAMGITVAGLQQLGWQVTAEGLRKSLPHFGITGSVNPATSAEVAQAAALARARAEVEHQLRGRGRR